MFVLFSTVDAANSFALVGLDHLEKTYPILNQSTDEVSTCYRCDVSVVVMSQTFLCTAAS